MKQETITFKQCTCLFSQSKRKLFVLLEFLLSRHMHVFSKCTRNKFMQNVFKDI
jgi:hypothetical protein